MITDEELCERAELASRVLNSAESVSAALRRWTGEELVIRVFAQRTAVMTPTEWRSLRGGTHSFALVREGMLCTRTSDRVVALTKMLVLPHRVPQAVRLAVGLPYRDDDDPDDVAAFPHDAHVPATELPFGQALVQTGTRFERQHRAARTVAGLSDGSGQPLFAGHPIVVESGALMVIYDARNRARRAALVTEQITRDLVERFTPPHDLVLEHPAEPVGDPPADCVGCENTQVPA